MNYQSIGSGGGIKQIDAKTVDFGASDMPLKPEDLDKNGLQQFPMVMGGVVPVVNLAGIQARPVEARRQGAGRHVHGHDHQMERSGDRQRSIPASNCRTKRSRRCTAPTGRAPTSSSPITCRASTPDFKAKVGENTSVELPGGLGGKGNEGVAALAGRTDGAIGYVEYAYALQNKMTYALLKNHDGNFVSPDSKTFQAAAANADWSKAPGFYLLLTDQPGKDSWPITGATFILMHNKQDKPESAREVLELLRLGLSQWRAAGRTARLRADAGKMSSQWSRTAGRRSSGRTASRYGTGMVVVLRRLAAKEAHRLRSWICGQSPES